jgi:hypothetical protein
MGEESSAFLATIGQTGLSLIDRAVLSCDTKGSAIHTPHARRSLFREVNERIREINAGLGSSADSSEVYCECGRLDCLERFEVPGDLYERVRRDGGLFFVKAGHEPAGEERFAAEGDTYRVIAPAPETEPERLRVPLRARVEVLPEAS